MVRYMTPGSSCEPNMVCVLPAPVAPYANTEIELQLKTNYYRVRHVNIPMLHNTTAISLTNLARAQLQIAMSKT